MKTCKYCGEEMDCSHDPGEAPVYSCECRALPECCTCGESVESLDENFECLACREKALKEQGEDKLFYDDLN